MSKFAEQYQRLGMEVPTTEDKTEKAQLIFNAACKKMGFDSSIWPVYPAALAKYLKSNIAHLQLMIIRDAITDNKEADWDDNEKKYEAWFWMNSPGFRLNGIGFGWTDSNTSSGSRLCTFSRLDHEFFTEECLPLWADFMGGKLPE